MRHVRPNPVVHLELHTSDPAGARALYGALCGWAPQRIVTAHGSYEALELGGGVGGGLVDCPADRSLWLPYAAVADIDVATDSARDLGAAVLLEPREGPAGWRSVIATRAGAELALWQSKG